MVVKDKFSNQSANYAQFRPDYPTELYDYILSFVPKKRLAWDCATGNGQVAKALAPHFDKVFANDISENQLENAFQSDNIDYFQCRSELTPFESRSFDLITVAQAVHWFDFPLFFKEARRVLRRTGVMAMWGYSLIRTYTAADRIIDDFYTNVVGPYWDNERKHIDTAYKIVPFPFKHIDVKNFLIKKSMTLDELEGYFNTWSSVQNFIQKNGESPVPDLIQKLSPHWESNPQQEVTFPVFMKLGSTPSH